MGDAAMSSREARNDARALRRRVGLLIAAAAVAAGCLTWRSDPVQDWWLSRQPVERLETLAETSPLCPRVRYHLSRTLFMQGEWPAAMSHALDGLRRHPQDLRLLRHVGMLHRSAAADHEALPFYERAYSLGDRSLELLRNLAEIKLTTAPARARVILAEAVDRYPNEAVCWALLGTLNEATGDRAAAIRALKRAVELDPEDYGIQRQLGEIYLAQGDLDQALRAVEPSLQRNPADRDAWAIKARALVLRGDVPVSEVDTAFRRAEFNLSGPGEQASQVWHDHGRYLLSCGKVREAIPLLEEAVRAAPRERKACTALVTAYRQVGELAHANAAARWLRHLETADRRIEALRARVTAAPTNRAVRIRLVRLLETEGRGEEAQRYRSEPGPEAEPEPVEASSP